MLDDDNLITRMKMEGEFNKPIMFGIPTNVRDPTNMSEVLAFVEELRSSSNGWQRCIESLLSGEIQDDRLKFLGLQTIELYLKNNYEKASQSEQNIIRQFLSRWIQLKCSQMGVADAAFVKNKAAQIFALAFVFDYPNRWPTFFSDLIDTLTLGEKAVDNFLRVLSAIDAEIADREMPYTEIQIQRNTLIKNAMRERCIEQIVTALYDILNTYQVTQPQLASMTLETLSNYVHWIDIGLVTNEHFISLLLKLLNAPAIRESAVICIQSIVHKGMDPVEKFTLVKSFICVLNNVGVFIRNNDDDSEFCSKLAQLVNEIGLALLDSYSKIHRNGPADTVPVLEQAIDSIVPIMVTFLGNDYDDVSSAVLEFAKDYIHYLKGRATLNETQLKNTQQLMVTVIHKMKYDESYKFDRDGEDEAEFQEFRKGLKVVFDNIVALNRDLVMNYLVELCTRAIADWPNVPFPEVEVSLAIIYYVGEVLPIHAGQYAPNDHVQLQSLIHLMLDSGLSGHPHPAVSLQFFEIMVRYQRILLTESSRILSVISLFLNTCGLRHSSAKVRSRTAYLFCKFIKGSKSVIQTFTNDIIAPLQELLNISNDQYNGSKEEWMSADDQLFLFEAAGHVIICSALPHSEIVSAFRTLLVPVVSNFDRLMKEIVLEHNEKRQEMLANSMCHMIAITTRTSKAFTTQTPMRSIGCVPVYVECLVMFLTSLQISVQWKIIQNGVRQFVHRMVVCLDADLLPYIPNTCEGLLKHKDIKSMQEFLPLLIQMFSKFKNRISYYLYYILAPIVMAVFNALRAPLDKADEDGKREKNTLRKLYFQFLSTLMTNSKDLFHGQDSVVKNEILMSVAEGAHDPTDPVMQKTCFVLYRTFLENSLEQSRECDFVKFLFQTGVRLCLEVVHKTALNPHTPNTDSVLMEVATTLKYMHDIWGGEFVTFVQNNCLADISPECRERFLNALQFDTKMLKNYIKNMYRQDL